MITTQPPQREITLGPAESRWTEAESRELFTPVGPGFRNRAFNHRIRRIGGELHLDPVPTVVAAHHEPTGNVDGGEIRIGDNLLVDGKPYTVISRNRLLRDPMLLPLA